MTVLHSRQTVGTAISTICAATKMVLLSHLYGNVSGLKKFDINIDAMEDTCRRGNEATCSRYTVAPDSLIWRSLR
jgi:hypothetical protein